MLRLEIARTPSNLFLTVEVALSDLRYCHVDCHQSRTGIISPFLTSCFQAGAFQLWEKQQGENYDSLPLVGELEAQQSSLGNY